MSGGDSGSLPRAAAAIAVDAVVRGGRNLDRALESAGIDSLDERSRPLSSALAYGTLRTLWRERDEIPDLRTAGFVAAIEKIAHYYREYAI